MEGAKRAVAGLPGEGRTFDAGAAAESHGHKEAPSSAAGFLEPFTTRIQIGPAPGQLEAEGFLSGLLDDLAAVCEAEGATLIGHIKCFLSSGQDRVHCSLASRRTGAHCGASTAGSIPLERAAELHLAVLVYGLPADTVRRLAHQTLDRHLLPLGIAWRPL